MGSARGLARLTQAHDAYRWVCGGVQVNYHTLSDFRSQQGDFLDEWLSANLAALMDAGVVRLKAVAQDGMRVRAHAGAASFRRQARVENHLEQARQRIAELKQQVDKDPGEDTLGMANWTRVPNAPKSSPRSPRPKSARHDQAEGAPAETIDPHTPKAGDSPAVAAWRERMGREDAKTR